MRVKNSLLVTFIILLFFGCDLQFEDNRRVLIVGQLNAPEGTNFEVIPIQVIASNSSDENIITQGFADSFGAYSLVSVVPSNARNVSLFVNSTNGNGSTATRFNSTELRGISLLNSFDNRVDVQDITIGPVIDFRFTISRIANTNTVVQTRFRFLRNPVVIDDTENSDLFNPNPLLGRFTDIDFTSVEDGREERNFNFTVIANDTIFFDYRILENDTLLKEDNLAIPIDGNQSFLFDL